MKIRFPLVTAAVIGAGAAIAFALPAGAAVSVQSESPAVSAVSLGSTATLDADGAVVFAPVKLACTTGARAYLQVVVTQNVGDAIASGYAGRSIDPCTGRQQRVTVAVTPTQKPFRKGVAFGQAILQVCDHKGCREVRDEHTIQITKK